ncbi:MAG TPA: acyl-CoA thioesterase II, partial [Mycobacterium sp.]
MSDCSSDFQELLAVLDLNRLADDLFVGSHPSKNPMRTFGGQLMAQSFVASSRTLTGDGLPP